MKCPKCNLKLYVVDSRHSDFEIKRRRYCKKCNLRFNTYEQIPIELRSTKTSSDWSSASLEIKIPNSVATYAVTNQSVKYDH